MKIYNPTDFHNLLKDFLKQMKFNIGRIIARVQRKYGFKYKDVVSRYWDEDYSNARKTKIWRNSFQFCKINGIIEQQTKESDIPLSMTGNIILIGMTFSNYFYF